MDTVTLTIKTTGGQTDVPENSPAFAEVIEGITGFTAGTGGDYTVDTPYTSGGAAPEIAFTLKDTAVTGDYILEYTGNDGTEDTTGMITLTVAELPTTLAADNLVASAQYGDPIPLDFASAITHDRPFSELDIEFTINDIPNLVDSDSPMPHGTSAGTGVEHLGNSVFRVTSDDGMAELRNDVDSARTVTGSYTVSVAGQGSGQVSSILGADITLTLAQSPLPRGPLGDLEFTLTAQEVTDGFSTTLQFIEVTPLLNRAPNSGLGNAYSGLTVSVATPGSLGGTASITNNPVDQGSVTSGVTTWDISYDPTADVGTETFTYSVTFGTPYTPDTPFTETGTLTFHLPGEFGAVNDLEVTAQFGDPIPLDFDSVITHLKPIGELEIEFTLDDIPNLVHSNMPIPHGISAGTGVTDLGNDRFEVTSNDGMITLTNDRDLHRIVTGTFKATSGAEFRTADITLTLLPSHDIAVPLDDITIRVSEQEVIDGLELTYQFIEVQPILNREPSTTFGNAYSGLTVGVTNPGSRGGTASITNNPVDQGSVTSGVTTWDFAYAPTVTTGVETFTYSVTFGLPYTFVEHTETATLTFILPGAECSASVDPNIDFGTLQVGQASEDRTVEITNDGDIPPTLMIHGGDWINDGTAYMDVGQTRYSLESGVEHASKTAMSSSAAELASSIPATESRNLYLSVLIEFKESLAYKGAMTQQMTLGHTCG